MTGNPPAPAAPEAPLSQEARNAALRAGARALRNHAEYIEQDEEAASVSRHRADTLDAIASHVAALEQRLSESEEGERARHNTIESKNRLLVEMGDTVLALRQRLADAERLVQRANNILIHAKFSDAVVRGEAAKLMDDLYARAALATRPASRE